MNGHSLSDPWAASTILLRAHRVLLVGPPGAGKSTLARALGPRLGLPVVHLDRIFWRAGWEPTPRDAWRAAQAALVQEQRWLIDGNYGSTLDIRLDRAQVAVFVDLPRRVYLWRVIRRVLSQYGRTRPDLAPGCPERLDLSFLAFVWRFARSERPQVQAALAAAQDRVQVIRLGAPRDVSRLLAALCGPDASTGASGSRGRTTRSRGVRQDGA